MLERLQRLLSAPEATLAENPGDLVPLARAVLLLEMAWADEELAAPEQETVRRLLARRCGLGPGETEELLRAAEQRRREATDHYAFTRLLRDRMDRPARLAILRDLWQVVYADGVLDAAEDALIHKFARLLDLSHQDLIALKLAVRDGGA